MKLSAVLCLAFLAVAHSVPMPDDDEHAHTDVGPHSSIRETMKAMATERRFGAGDSASAVRCVQTCAAQMKSQLGNTPSAGDMDTSEIAAQFNADTLNRICTAHDAATSCLNQCGNSQAKNLLMKALGLTQFMCHDSNFRANAQCLKDASSNVESTCQARDRCGAFKQNIDRYKTDRPTTLEGLKDMMRQTCKYTKCALDCGKPTIVSRCGQSAQDDLEGISSKAIDFLKTTMEALGLGSTFPSECSAIIN